VPVVLRLCRAARHQQREEKGGELHLKILPVFLFTRLPSDSTQTRQVSDSMQARRQAWGASR
jgi:hypothetical protein